MGMRIQSGGGAQANATSATGGAAAWQQRKQQFQDLSQALQSNNLDAAKAAFAKISSADPKAASNPNSPLAQLGKALQGGDLAGAQQVMASMASKRPHRADGDADDGAKSSASTPPPSPPTATTGNLLNVVA